MPDGSQSRIEDAQLMKGICQPWIVIPWDSGIALLMWISMWFIYCSYVVNDDVYYMLNDG